MTSHTKKELLLPIKQHIDLVNLEFPMEKLAYLTEDLSQSSNQAQEAMVTKIKVSVLAVNIASYSLRPKILISTIP